MTITALMPVYPRCDVRPVRGEGCYLISEDGRRFLDFASGIAVNLLGHGHPHLTQAIQDQAATLIHVSNLYGSPQGEALAQRLIDNSFADTVFLHQFGRRGGRVRDQDRAALPFRHRQSAAHDADRVQERVPRPHARHDLGGPIRTRCAAGSSRCCPASATPRSTISPPPRR